MPRIPKWTFAALAALTTAAAAAWLSHSHAVSASQNSPGPAFVEFESGPVRPVALSPDGTTLFAVNTPNGTLEVFTSRPRLAGL